MFTVRTAQTAKPGRHRVEKNLFFEVSDDGSKRWLYRFTSPLTRRVTEAGLGTFPVIGLAAARAKAIEYRALVAKGVDPIQAKRAARAATLEARKKAMTLGDALTAYATAFAGKGKTAERAATLRRHAQGLLTQPLDKITTEGALTALAPVQAAKPKTAARARSAISAVFDYAEARGWFTGANPARVNVFRRLVPAPPSDVPYKMCPVDQIPALFARLSDDPTASHLCLQWLILTCARSQEAIRIEWADIDLGQRLWTVPPHKTKTRRVHRVPISTQALGILGQARDRFGAGGYVFPGFSEESPLNPRVLDGVMRRQLRQPYTVHAMRATFSTWANEAQGFAFEDVEACLAHQVGNAVSRAYDRAERIAKRAIILQAWSNFVTGHSNVVSFPATIQPQEVVGE
jgi:integrase